ncbi:nitroreductase family protein [Patulibacter sp.]|uniref:nitroreductase family protein n=1 Tax=Patulibacter sp. TaxID=1912859 RepID=UPI0027233EA9|nr:nitroreductase family protein [Patulibacter sp.]MDO9408037.1 nitroreductase family protein [Patulibacter sp.]
MDLTEAMRTQNACCYYKPDPVPDQVFYNAVEAARFGPQGGNRQPVRFLIVRDPEKKKQLAEWYEIPWRQYIDAMLAGQDAVTEEGSGVAKSTKAGLKNLGKAAEDADHFARHLAEHPAIVVACADIAETHPTDTALDRLSIVGGASVYPTTQNFCLALRDQGVATRFTTLLVAYEEQVKELLGIPKELATAAHIVAGYPLKGFPKKLTRRPVEEIAFLDSFDHPLTSDAAEAAVA